MKILFLLLSLIYLFYFSPTVTMTWKKSENLKEKQLSNSIDLAFFLSKQSQNLILLLLLFLSDIRHFSKIKYKRYLPYEWESSFSSDFFMSSKSQ